MTSLRGAFYLHLLLAGHPNAKITINAETGPTARLMIRNHEAREGDLINVTITHDWPGPDPRGPGKESVLWTFDPATKRPVRKRPPCELQTVIHRKDLHDARFVDRVAETAASRLDRELERGYAEIRHEPLPTEDYTWGFDRAILVQETESTKRDYAQLIGRHGATLLPDGRILATNDAP